MVPSKIKLISSFLLFFTFFLLQSNTGTPRPGFFPAVQAGENTLVKHGHNIFLSLLRTQCLKS